MLRLNHPTTLKPLAALVLSCLEAFAMLASTAGPSTDRAAVIDDCRYDNAAAAQAVWKPMAGSKPVGVTSLNGRPALHLSCNFVGTKIERASWDAKFNVDLSANRGVQFYISCRDVAPISQFSIYFQSGDGWYSASFFPENSSGWNFITIDKADTRTEGRPAGWGHIRTIRISAWRGKDTDTEFFLSGLRKTGVLGADASVAIVRAESAAQRSPDEANSVAQFTETVAQNLAALDVDCAIVSDLDLSAQKLKRDSVGHPAV